jgi:hypothetical protein
VANLATLLGHQPAPGRFSTRSFPVAFYSLKDQCSYYGTVKFCGKEGSLPLNPSTHLLLPHFSSKTLVHPLPCHGSLQCSVHRGFRKENPTIERGINRQGHVMCVDHIYRPTEGLRCCKGGHWRSRRAIGEDGRPAMVCGQSVPRDEGRSPPAHHGSTCT